MTTASVKQVSFIQSLAAERAYNVDNCETLSVKEASNLIASLLSMPKAMAAPKAKASPLVGEGVYFHTGHVVKVKRAIHGSGRLYSTVFNPETTQWDYKPAVLMVLTEEDRLTYEKAKEFGQLYGMCAVCGRTRTDEESIANGIGPICAGKF